MMFDNKRANTFLDIHCCSFDDNALIIFKQHLNSSKLDRSLLLSLINCIHQLAIDNQLEQVEIIDMIRRLDRRLVHNECNNHYTMKFIRDLENRVSNTNKSVVHCHLSSLMRILVRIDQLTRHDKLDRDKVHMFTERLTHLSVVFVFFPLIEHEYLLSTMNNMVTFLEHV
jgi:hypothetical protein